MNKESGLAAEECIQHWLDHYRRAARSELGAFDPYSPVLFASLNRTNDLEAIAMKFGDAGRKNIRHTGDRRFSDVFDVPVADGTWIGSASGFMDLYDYDPSIRDLQFMVRRKAQLEQVPGATESHATTFTELVKHHYPQLIEAALNRATREGGYQVGQFMLPQELIDIVLGLATASPGMKVYDPFAGLAGFGVALPGGVEYLANEVNGRTRVLGNIRLRAQHPDRCLDSNDPMNDWGRFRTDSHYDEGAGRWGLNVKDFDRILLDLLRVGKLSSRMGSIPHPTKDMASAAIQMALSSLGRQGRVIALVPERLLYAAPERTLRDHLVRTGLLHSVISLPQDLFRPYTSVKTSLVVLAKDRARGTPIRYVDAASFIKANTGMSLTLDAEGVVNAYWGPGTGLGVLDVREDELRADEDLSWAMSRYSSRLQMASILAEAGGVAVVSLDHVLHDDVLSLGDHAGLPLFQVAELSSDVLDLTRSARHGRTGYAAGGKGMKRLDVMALLLARVGGKLKPTLFDPVDGPIVVGSNVLMLRVDTERVDPEYLAMELRSSIVQDQLDAYHQGSTIESIAKADLFRIKVRLPDRPEQLRIVRERKEAILLAKKEEIARQEKQHGLSTDEWRILGAVEHSFRPVLALVEQPMEAIRQLASELDATKRSAVSAELAKVNTGLDRMRGLFKLINDVISSDKESIRRVPVDLRRLFRTEVRGLALELKKLQVYFQCEAGLETPDGVIAKVDPRQFALVVQNLLTNMAKHACRPEMKELHVLVRVGTRQEPGRTWLVITIENDGKPFPEGFTHRDLITFGKRLDATNGNGIGGYLMDRIIANHNGRFTSCNLDLDERTARSGFSKDQRLDENREVPIDWELDSTHMTVRFTIELPMDNTEQND